MALTEETVRDERRAGVSVSFSAANLAWYLIEMGRPDEALACAKEAAASEAIHGLRVGPRAVEAWTHFLRGDADGAELARSYARVAETVTEPQSRVMILVIHAWARWTYDREGALAELTAAIDERDRRFGVDWLDMVHEAARMALRLRDRKRLEETIALHQRTRWHGGPALDARYRWIDGLATDDGGAAVEKAAKDLARVDYVRKAMDAWTDAALMAARAGRPSDAQERAQALADATGMPSLLGPPEPTAPDRANQEPS